MMDWEYLKEVVLVGMVPLGIYLYHKYMKWTAPESPGGETITWDELVEMFSDSEFWAHVEEVKDAVQK